MNVQRRVKKHVPVGPFVLVSSLFWLDFEGKKKFNRWDLSGKRYKNYETFTFLPRFCRNWRNPDCFLSKQIATIRLHHWFVYTALSRPKSAQTRAATAKVTSRCIKKLLIHRGNEAMSLSVSLPVLLLRIKNNFGLTKIAIYGFLPKKNGNLSFLPWQGP